MNEEKVKIPTNLDAKPNTVFDQENKAGKQRREKLQKSAIIPEISTFFSDPDVRPAAFFKAVRLENIKYFERADRERAITAIEADISGARLWAMMSQARLPQVVDNWIWPVVQDRLKSAIMQGFNSDSMSPSEILEKVCEVLSPRIRAGRGSVKEKLEAKIAENWLRIALCWLIRTKSINIWEIAKAISPIFYTDTKKAKSLFHRAISKGNQKELRLSVATVTMGDEVVAEWKSDLTRERRVSDGLRIKLDIAEGQKKGLSKELAATRNELAQEGQALKAAKKQYEDDRHHWGHDLTEIKTNHRRFLEQIKPLLTDAVDELEMEPADPKAALKHLKAVLKKIQQEGI